MQATHDSSSSMHHTRRISTAASTSRRRFAVAVVFAIPVLVASGARAFVGLGSDFPNDTANNLTLEVTGTPDPARVGDRIALDLLVCNSGDVDATGAKITGITPTGVAFPVATNGATCTTGGCGPGATVTWNLGTLVPHRCRTVGISWAVQAAATDGTAITFTYDLLVDGGNTVSDALTITADSTSALAIEMVEDADPVSGGDVIWYTIAYSNRSTGNVLNGLLSAPVPAGATLLSIEDGGSEAGGNIAWPLGTIAAGVSGRRRFSVTVDEPAVDGTGILAEAEVTGAGESARATLSTAVVSTELLSLHLDAGPDAVARNARVTYDLTVCNSDVFDATGVFVDSLVPNGHAFAVSVGATCSTGGCGAGAFLQWNVGTVEAGRCIVRPLSEVANAVASGELVRQAFRLRADGDVHASAARIISRDDPQALVLTLSEDREPVAAGEDLTYTVTYGVTSATNSLATKIRAWVPEGTTLDSIGSGGTEADGVITWDLATLRSGESGQRRFTVTVDPAALDGTAIDATAEIDAGASFGTTASQSTIVNGEGDLTLHVTAQPDPVRLNERTVYDITFCNSGIDDATGLDLDAIMPNGLSFPVANGATCSTGGCGAGGLLNWDLGSVASHRCRTLQTSINNSLGGAGYNTPFTLRLRSDNRQTAMAERVVVADATPSLSLAITEDRDPVAPGDAITYTIIAGNRNASENIAGTLLEFFVPAGTTLTTVGDGGTETDGVVTWDLATMAAGNAIRRKVAVTVDSSIADGSSVVAETRVTGGSPEKLGARASQTTAIVSAETLTFDLLASQDPSRVGDGLFFDLVLCNRGVADATGVGIEMLVPNYLAFARSAEASPTCSTGGCGAGAFITFTPGQVLAGRCRNIGLFETVSSAALGEMLIPTAMVRADGGSYATAARAVPLDTRQPLTSFISEEVDPVAPGAETTYKVTFGNRSTSTVSDSQVRVTIPPHATVTSASLGAVLDGDQLTWNLCPVTAGQSATYSYTVMLDDSTSLPDGSALLTDLDFSSIDGNPPSSHAAASTAVVDQAPLSLAITATPGDVAKPNDQITYDFTTCNHGVGQVTGVSVRTWTPPSTTTVTIQDGGVADSAGIGWTIDAINAGECATVSLVVRVNTSTSYLGDGYVIFSEARVSVDGGERASATNAIRTCSTTAGTCTVKPPPPCGAPQSRACNRTASDALAVLRTAVHLRDCPLCECDVDGSGSVTASDALATLRFSVGQAVTLRCPACL